MLDFKGSSGQARITCLNKNCTQLSCAAVANLGALLGWRNLECKRPFSAFFFTRPGRKCPAMTPCSLLVPFLPFPYASFLIRLKTPSILLAECCSLEPSHAVFSLVSFLPRTLAFLDVQLPQGMGWARGRTHRQRAPPPALRLGLSNVCAS